MYRAGKEEIEAIARVINSKQWFRFGDEKAGHLREVELFEKEWAEKMGVPYALLMSGGGTAAITCALAAAGVGPGDEVVVPAYTWLATASSVLSAGAIPILAEVDETLGLDPEDLKRRMGPRTKAVIPVHMAGRPANLEAIKAICSERGLRMIEDSCQMDGGKYKGRRTGTWGDAGAYSLNYFKIISAGGEGGCLVTSDRKLYERALIYHDSGAAFRPITGELKEPIFVAQQYRASELMGAVARVQLGRMDGIIEDLRKMRKRLEQAVSGEGGTSIAPSNDSEGDCGVALALQFGDEAGARAFAGETGVGGLVVIDHGKHVYTEWAPLRAKRAYHHPEMNPFNFPANREIAADYSEKACPRTLQILRRTVFVFTDPDWTDEQVERKASALAAAARKV